MTKKLTRRAVFGMAGGAAVAAAAGYAISRRVRGGKTPPNIVLIVSDAFRADRLSARRNGASITPHLDALAAGGVVYENCYAPSSWTKTSMASILTGTYPPYNGVLTPSDTIPKNCDTIANMLKRQGWATYAVQTNPWLAPEAPTLKTEGKPVREYGFHKGFDLYKYILPGTPDKAVEQPAYADAQAANAAVKRALTKLKRPFFLYIHYMETHQPWMGFLPREFTGAYCSRRDGRSQGAVFQDDQKLIRKIFSSGERDVTANDKERLQEIYDEAVRYVDEIIGAALSNVAKVSPPDETLIIFTADHGDELFDHGQLGHAHTLFEELARVPLVINGPGIKPDRVTASVSNVNIYETIRAAACPEDQHREPICRVLPGVVTSASAANDEVIFAELHPPMPDTDWTFTKVIREDRQSAIVKKALDGALIEVTRHDLAHDPLERAPLPGDDAEAFVSLAARLARDYRAMALKHNVAYTETMAKWQRRFAEGGGVAGDGDLTEEEKKLQAQLRALGYLN